MQGQKIISLTHFPSIQISLHFWLNFPQISPIFVYAIKNFKENFTHFCNLIMYFWTCNYCKHLLELHMQWFCSHLLRIVCIQYSECWSQNALNGWVDKNEWNSLWYFWLHRQKWVKSGGYLVKNGGKFGLMESELKK